MSPLSPGTNVSPTARSTAGITAGMQLMIMKYGFFSSLNFTTPSPPPKKGNIKIAIPLFKNRPLFQVNSGEDTKSK